MSCERSAAKKADDRERRKALLARGIAGRKAVELLHDEWVIQDSLRREAACNRRLAVNSAATIRALQDRLNRIEGLARHAIAAKPRDLEETWFRVEQIAGTEGG